MNYRPPEEWHMWDVWTHIEDDICHLYHLRTEAQGWGDWDLIGHAVSRDLLNWEERPMIAFRGPKGAWDDGPIGTGSVFKLPTGQRIAPRPTGRCRANSLSRSARGIRQLADCQAAGYAMAYCVFPADKRGAICLAFSDDLDTWEKYEGNPISQACGPHYEADIEQTASPRVDWRDPFVTWREDLQQFEAIFCARSSHGPHYRRGCVGRALSPDGLHWETVTPLIVSDRYNALEVPTRFDLKGRHYVIFNTHRHFEPWFRTGRYPIMNFGTFYAVSENIDGPFVFPEENSLTPGNGVVGRAMWWREQPLFIHHIRSRRPALGLPKRIAASEDGCLSLAYWEGSDSLRVGEIPAEPQRWQPYSFGSVPYGTFAAQGDRLVGECSDGPMYAFLPERLADADLICEIDPKDARRVGLLLREEKSQGALAVVADRMAGELQARPVERSPDTGLCILPPTERCTLDLDAMEHPFELRVLHRWDAADVYLDGRLVWNLSLDAVPGPGRVGLMVSEGRAAFRPMLYRLRP